MTPLAVTCSIVDPEALAAHVAAHYRLGEASDCSLLRFGLNDTYALRLGGTRYVVRVYRRGWRERGDMLHELDALRWLNARGIRVSAPMSTADGRPLIEIATPEGDRAVVLFTFAPGSPLPMCDMRAIGRFGADLARIHGASDGFTSPHPRFEIDRRHLVDQPVVALRPLLRDQSDAMAAVEALAADLRGRIEALPALDRGFCHGDAHRTNAHVAEDGSLIIFDFDCCGRGWRAYDLAVFRWNSRGEDAAWKAFVAGYLTQRPLAPADLDAIPVFVAARELWHWGLHAASTPVHGRAWFDDTCIDRRLATLHELIAAVA